jgi:transcriptional regulator GlxA family with amidase domain
VTGGAEPADASGDQDLIADASTLAGRARIHTSVCSGVFLLAAAGKRRRRDTLRQLPFSLTTSASS